MSIIEGTRIAELVYCRKVERRLIKRLRTLSERGPEDVIPITSYKRISNNGGRLPEGVVDKVRKMGVLIIRDVIPAREIEDMMTDLISYMHDNKAFPQDRNQTQVIPETILNGYLLCLMSKMFLDSFFGNWHMVLPRWLDIRSKVSQVGSKIEVTQPLTRTQK